MRILIVINILASIGIIKHYALTLGLKAMIYPTVIIIIVDFVLYHLIKGVIKNDTGNKKKGTR